MCSSSICALPPAVTLASVNVLNSDQVFGVGARQIYGPGVEKLKVDVRPFKFKSSEVEVTFLSSNYHIELNPSDVGPYRDRDVAQEVIKEIAQSHAPSTAAGGLFKVIVLNEVDKMSRDGQVGVVLSTLATYCLSGFSP